ncbi:MAG: hypothetical protein IPK70_06615 [Flavobacteriales bacterium]|nr:hypothetical protein [Flavobacteriales bacterium]
MLILCDYANLGTGPFDWSAFIAALAIIASVILQLITLRNTREQTVATLAEARASRQSSTAAEQFRHMDETMSNNLADYFTLTYWLAEKHKEAVKAEQPWPGALMDQVNQEHTIYNRIRLRLNPMVRSEKELEERLQDLRNPDHHDTWPVKCGRVVSAYQTVMGEWRSRFDQ